MYGASSKPCKISINTIKNKNATKSLHTNVISEISKIVKSDKIRATGFKNL